MWRRLLPCAAIALAACSASGGSQASEAQADVFTAIGADANAAEPDTSGSPEPDPFAEVLTADVRVVVNYAGAVTGPLQVGAFTTNPPTGAPAPLAAGTECHPGVLPAAGTPPAGAPVVCGTPQLHGAP